VVFRPTITRGLALSAFFSSLKDHSNINANGAIAAESFRFF
jgi:hypothetical protein